MMLLKNGTRLPDRHNRCTSFIASPMCGAFLCLKFNCCQGSPWEGLDVDSRIVRRTETTPAARAPLPHHAVRVVRDWISETDAIGCRRCECLWRTARKDERTYSGPRHLPGLFVSGRWRLPNSGQSGLYLQPRAKAGSGIGVRRRGVELDHAPFGPFSVPSCAIEFFFRSCRNRRC